MLIASMSIFCRKRTTGASSTSTVISAFSGAGPSSSVTSKSKSPPASDSMTSLADALWLSICRISLSYSTITHSGVSCVANLMRSAASWSVGSAAPMNRRLPRLPSAMSWYWLAILLSSTLRGSFCKSTALRSSSGSAKAAASVCASSAGCTAPAAITEATKLVRLSLADLPRSSAAFAVSLPACTNTRATPLSELLAGSARVSAVMRSRWMCSVREPIDHRRSSPGL